MEVFHSSGDLTKPHGLWEGASTRNHHSAKFGGNKHCGSGDIIVFVYHVTLQVLVLKGSCDFTESHHHAKFGDHKNCGSEDTFLFCHVILQDRVIKRSCYFMGGSPSR